MLSIKATNPRIIQIARKFDKKYPDVFLAKEIESACYGDKESLVFLSTTPLLRRNADRFLPESSYKQSRAYKKYLCAVAQAQIHLGRENNEYEALKGLIKLNFAESKHGKIFPVIKDIAGELSETVSPEAEINFLNYLIDHLSDMSQAKWNDRKFIVGDIDSELTSNKNGFILRGNQPEEIKNLFIEAVQTPLQLNEKGYL